MNAQKKAIENEKSTYIPNTLHNKRKNNHTNFYVSFNSFSIAQCVSDSGHYNFVSMFVVRYIVVVAIFLGELSSFIQSVLSSRQLKHKFSRVQFSIIWLWRYYVDVLPIRQ